VAKILVTLVRRVIPPPYLAGPARWLSQGRRHKKWGRPTCVPFLARSVDGGVV